MALAKSGTAGIEEPRRGAFKVRRIYRELRSRVKPSPVRKLLEPALVNSTF